MKMSNNPVKYEVLIKEYLRSILDISVWRRLNVDGVLFLYNATHTRKLALNDNFNALAG